MGQWVRKRDNGLDVIYIIIYIIKRGLDAILHSEKGLKRIKKEIFFEFLENQIT